MNFTKITIMISWASGPGDPRITVSTMICNFVTTLYNTEVWKKNKKLEGGDSVYEHRFRVRVGHRHGAPARD